MTGCAPERPTPRTPPQLPSAPRTLRPWSAADSQQQDPRTPQRSSSDLAALPKTAQPAPNPRGSLSLALLPSPMGRRRVAYFIFISDGGDDETQPLLAGVRHGALAGFRGRNVELGG